MACTCIHMHIYTYMHTYTQVVDGKVERDEQGKEKRYPVSLTAKEKLIARQVCLAFKVGCHGNTPPYGSILRSYFP